MAARKVYNYRRSIAQNIVATCIVLAVLTVGLYAADLMPHMSSDEFRHTFSSSLSWAAPDAVERFFVILIKMVGYSI